MTVQCPNCKKIIAIKEKEYAELRRAYIYSTLADNNFNRTNTAKAMGVNVKTVTNWVRNLRNNGYNVPESKYTAFTRTVWDEYETAMLEELWSTCTIKEIAKKLNRSFESVRARAAKIGLQRKQN